MQHLDEGTIHAWLDGQLPREEAQQVEAHIADCRPCADAVAEARGLIAASTRILTALDNVPRDVLPASPPMSERATPKPAIVNDPPATGPAHERARRRWFNGVTLAAAATIVVAVGTTILMRPGYKQRLDLANRSGSTAVSVRSSDSFPVAASLPAVAGTPAAAPPAPESAKSLGGANQPAGQPFAAIAPANEAANATRLESDRAAPRPTTGAATEGKAVVDRVADSAGGKTLTVMRGRVVEPVDSVARAKTTGDLNKDAKAERPQSALFGTPATSGEIRIRGANSLRTDSSTAVVAQSTPAAPSPAPVSGGSVHGRVTDANNTGLADAMVTVVGTRVGVVTNAAGEYTLGGLTSGSHRLVVRRIGYDSTSRQVTVVAGQTSAADIVLRPAQTTLSEVVTTGTAGAASAPARKAAPARDRADATETPPGAPITATQSNAVGCYELGITATTATTAARNGFRQVPRQVALDAEIVPANADGVWYRARDLARTAPLPNGLWRPSGPDAIEIEWTYGSRTARIRVAGLASSMMRGTLEEIDRATATGEAGTVVAVRRSCAP
jgi:anti-sigma factor RsiW